MDRLEAMSVFAAVVDAGSLSAAARRLAMPLATVSRKLSDLENHLRTRLVTRTTRHLALTDAGRDYLDACRRILENVDAAERAASGEHSAVRGGLVMTAPVVFGRLHVVPVLVEFLAAWPAIDVRLVLGDGIANLLEEHIDIAMRIGELPDSGLVAAEVGAIRRVVCASPAYLASRGRPLRPEDLAAHDCVAFDSQASGGVWQFPAKRNGTRVKIRARLAVNNADAAIAAAIAGLGVTRVLSYQVADGLGDGRLECLLEEFEPEPMPASLVYSGQGPRPAKLRALVDFALPRLRARLKGAPGGDAAVDRAARAKRAQRRAAS